MESVNNSLSLGSATHAAKRAADVIFILQNNEKLDCEAIIEHLNATLKAYGENNPQITQADLNDLKTVSKKLFVVFTARNVETASISLNEILNKYARAPRLSAHSASPWHLHIDSDDHAPWAEWFATSSALALAILLTEKQRNPGGLCASLTCGRPFIDLGKGGGRNYCSPKCATRERVIAYRKRR